MSQLSFTSSTSALPKHTATVYDGNQSVERAREPACNLEPGDHLGHGVGKPALPRTVSPSSAAPTDGQAGRVATSRQGVAAHAPPPWVDRLTVQQNHSWARYRDDPHGVQLYDSSAPSSSAPSPVPWDDEDESRARTCRSPWQSTAATFQATASGIGDHNHRQLQRTLSLHHDTSSQYPSPTSAPSSPVLGYPKYHQHVDTRAILERLRRRRENHNVVERRRRDTINNTINDIAKALPARYLRCIKPNKGFVLKTALEYINDLKKENISLRKRLGFRAEDDTRATEGLPLVDVSVSKEGAAHSSSWSPSHERAWEDTRLKSEDAFSVSARLYAAAAAAVDAGKGSAMDEQTTDGLRQQVSSNPQSPGRPTECKFQLPELVAPSPLRRPACHLLFPPAPPLIRKLSRDSSAGITLPPLSSLGFDSNPPSGCPSPVLASSPTSISGSPPFLHHPLSFQHQQQQQVPAMVLQPPDILISTPPFEQADAFRKHERSPCASPNAPQYR